jgi:diguanylate cyclase (GGDEF)-like protein
MKIGEKGPLSRLGAAARGAAARATGRAAKASSVKAPDLSAVKGIPEAEFTPKVRDAIVALMHEVAELRGELQRYKARVADLERLADMDALVEIPNRRAFVRELARTMSYSERYGTSASLLYFDLNGFKEINDTYGHAAGDAALRYVARVLTENVRESDVVGRLGGDEFGVILAQADEKQARVKAEGLAATIGAKRVSWSGKRLIIRLAFGVYALKPGEDPGSALAAADRAMYSHKATLKSDGG